MKKKKEYYEDKSLYTTYFDVKYFTDVPDNINEITKEKYPVSIKKALEIANKDENLKTDIMKEYLKKYHAGVGFLEFTDKDVDIIELNNKKYWKIQVTGGKIGYRNENGKFCDGHISKSDLLVCLIDVETGEYIYYPQNKENK